LSELIVGMIGMVMLYGLGRVLYPDPPHKTIQQELIKMGDEKHEE